MSESDLIERLASAVAQRIQPAVPFDMQLWDISTIATYIHRSEASVRERLACRPDFPKARRLPSETGRRGGHPLYKAAEVIDWVEKHADN